MCLRCDSLGPGVFQRSWSDEWGPLASCPTSKFIGYFVACICDETLLAISTQALSGLGL